MAEENPNLYIVTTTITDPDGNVIIRQECGLEPEGIVVNGRHVEGTLHSEGESTRFNGGMAHNGDGLLEREFIDIGLIMFPIAEPAIERFIEHLHDKYKPALQRLADVEVET